MDVRSDLSAQPGRPPSTGWPARIWAFLGVNYVVWLAYYVVSGRTSGGFPWAPPIMTAIYMSVLLGIPMVVATVLDRRVAARIPRRWAAGAMIVMAPLAGLVLLAGAEGYEVAIQLIAQVVYGIVILNLNLRMRSA